MIEYLIWLAISVIFAIISYHSGKNHGISEGFKNGKLFGLDQGYNMGFNEGRASTRTVLITKPGKKVAKKKKSK